MDGWTRRSGIGPGVDKNGKCKGVDGVRDRERSSCTDKDKDRGNDKERNGDRDGQEHVGLSGKESRDGNR